MNNSSLAIDFGAIASRINNPLSVSLENSNIFVCIDEFIKSKSRFSEKVANTYKCLSAHILDYQNILRFQFKADSFILYPKHWNDEVFTGFVYTLVNKGLSQMYVNKLMQKMKLVLEWSAKHGAKIDPTYNDVCKIEDKPSKELVALTMDDVSWIYHFDLNASNVKIYNRSMNEIEIPKYDIKHPLRYRLKMKQRQQRVDTMERVRDAFVLSCCMGQRYSDMVRISKLDFEGDKFRIVQQKTGGTSEVDIPKFAVDELMVRKILEKYNYEFPYKAHISAYDRNLHALFKTMGMENDMRRTIRNKEGVITSEVFSRYECIASHTARRTFVTTNLNKGISSRDVRIATGHKSESAFTRYDKGHTSVANRL